MADILSYSKGLEFTWSCFWPMQPLAANNKEIPTNPSMPCLPFLIIKPISPPNLSMAPAPEDNRACDRQP